MKEILWLALIPLGFLAIGLIFAALGVRGWRSQGSFERRATARANAIVTDIRHTNVGSGADRSTIAYPVVRFTLPDGRTVESEAMAVDHPGSKWRRKGVEAAVIYDPANPTSVAIEGSTKSGRLLYGCFTAFGVVFALIGLTGFVLGAFAFFVFTGGGP